MNQKFEDMLNLALEIPEEERSLSENLKIGYDGSTKSWELIVKYSGSLERIKKLGIGTEELIAGYGILHVPENMMDTIGDFPEIEYVEKPKRYYFSQLRPTESGCILQTTLREPFLSGKGVLIGILDSGIDFRRAEFIDAKGKSRILYLWDQTLQPSAERKPPEGFDIGVEFTGEELLTEKAGQIKVQTDDSVDISGHGTAVAGIAAGNSTAYKGIATQCDLLIVKLGNPTDFGFPKTTEIMRAVTYAVKKALMLNKPLVINLSFGNNYGAHDGTSLLERFLDNASEIGRTAICVGSGNEGNAAGHVAGKLKISRSGRTEPQGIELVVGEYERNLSIQLWNHYTEEILVNIIAPSGQRFEISELVEKGTYTAELMKTKLLIYAGLPTPFSVNRELFIEMIPGDGTFIDSGIWRLEIVGEKIVTGQYKLYLSGNNERNRYTGFLTPSTEETLTIPSTATKVITVGAYEEEFEAYADFSGRGSLFFQEISNKNERVVLVNGIKPDLVAPGVDLPALSVFGGYQSVTGTSFATPIVSGSAALLMEWGIVQGHDPYLYGEKLKAYLHKGAKPIRGISTYPNNKVGWGAVCVQDSF